jgi:hypothetical protein
MKKLLTASLLALGVMSGTASAALLEVVGGSAVTLDGDYDPNPATPGAASGDTVLNTFGLGNGLKLSAASSVTFTYLGKEAGFNNFFFQGVDLFNTGSSSTGASQTLNVTPGAGGFLPFKFRSDGSIDFVNGSVTSAFGSIAFKIIGDASDDTMTVLALLNDHFEGDADYDDMVIKIVATRLKDDGTNEIPLPGGVVLLMSGLAGLGFMGRARKQA